MAGYGDELMRTGRAKGAAARGKRIAFGDGTTILWDRLSQEIFDGNPNVARPGSEGAADLEWIRDYKGNRLYNQQMGNRWRWRYSHKAIPGELYRMEAEREYAKAFEGVVVIEPNVPTHKVSALNKNWDSLRYDAVARALTKMGHTVVQFRWRGSGRRCEHAQIVPSPSFRHVCAVMERAKLVICPEGGLHHGAAAVGARAVVLFGGFIPPAVTGYSFHANLTGGAEPCGSLFACAHCADAMNKITVDEVVAAAEGLLAEPVTANDLL